MTKTILNALSCNAHIIPMQSALIYEKSSYTWSELDELSSRIAVRLAKLGAGKGKCVGIKTHNIVLGIIAIWSVLKSSAAYLPLNPMFPEVRLKAMMKDAGAEIILKDLDIERLISETKTKRVIGELPQIAGDDIYAVMYTSGSTGFPKPVMLLHRDAVFYARHYIETVGLTKNDHIAMYSGLSFVLHIADLYAHALSGATLHIIPAEMRLDVRKIAEYFDLHSITVTAMPTAIGRKFAENAFSETLRALTVVGEKLSPFTPCNPKLKIFNAYGCTECGGGISIGEIKSGETHVGKEAKDIVVKIVDENGNVMPDGNEGELWVEMSGRQHKTGDIAKRNIGGNIEITGRTDFQLNIRGYRIEPGDIETHILSFPSIAEAVVVMSGERLVAYIATENTIDAAKLKNHLSGLLPPYMIPAVFVKLDKLPRNSNGKIDRTSLPEAFIARKSSEEPQGETEKELAAIWKKILGMNDEKVFREDSFIELGGDSLALVMLSVEIEERFIVTITPAELQKNDVLKNQIKLINDVKDAKPLFTFRETGEYAPLFFVHSANTGPEAYQKLSKKMPVGLPFYAFEHYDLVFNKKLGIKELAKKYIHEIKPCSFYLGGWSVGGLIAFEMALIMERAGLCPLHLFLLDPQINGEEERKIYSTLGMSPYYREYLERDLHFERFRKMGLFERLMENNSFMVREASEYIPGGVLKCPVTLFRMTLPDEINYADKSEQILFSRLWDLKKEDNGFRPYVENLKIVSINDTHDRALTNTASLNVIANEIEKCVSKREGMGV